MTWQPSGWFPSAEHRDSLRAFLRGHSRPGELDLAKLPEQHRFEWHAYDYGWRAAMGLTGGSPIDPAGVWRTENLVRIAATWFRKILGIKDDAYDPGPRPADDAVRPNWRAIRIPDLTPAERRLAETEHDERMRRLRAEDQRQASAVERMIGDPFAVPPAREIPPP